MEKLFAHMLDNFDIINSKNCSFRACSNRIAKQVLIYEFQLNLVKKEIALLSMCRQHYPELSKIIKDLKALEPKKIIMTKSTEVLE